MDWFRIRVVEGRPLASLFTLACLILCTCTVAGAVEEIAAGPVEAPATALTANGLEDRGIELAGGKIWLSAFFNLAFEALSDQPKEINLDDIGVLGRWEVVDRLSLFAALEIEDFATWIDGDGFEAASGSPALERFYADVAVAPRLSLQLGKTLAPFGIWNPIRRAPLTWTVDRPLITEVSFPLHVSGITLNHRSATGAWSVDGDLYVQPADEVDRIDDEKAANGLVGGRVSLGHPVPDGYLVTGLNGAWFEDKDTGEEQYAVGADLDLTFRGTRLTSELILANSSIEEDDEELPVTWGGYCQLVSPIYGRFYSVVRGEVVGLRHHDDYLNLILGLAYRSRNDRWLLKINYQFSDHAVDGRTNGPSVALSFLF